MLIGTWLSTDILISAGKLLAVFSLALVNGFFVAAAFALVGIRRSRVEEMAAGGSAPARMLGRVLERFPPTCIGGIELTAAFSASSLSIPA